MKKRFEKIKPGTKFSGQDDGFVDKYIKIEENDYGKNAVRLKDGRLWKFSELEKVKIKVKRNKETFINIVDNG